MADYTVARDLYNCGVSLNAIANKLQLPISTIRGWRDRRNWNLLRQKVNPSLQEALTLNSAKIQEIIALLADSSMRSLVALQLQDGLLDIKEIKMATDAMKTLQEYDKLENAMPTAIVQQVDLSMNEVKQGLFEALQNLKDADPIHDYEEIEVEFNEVLGLPDSAGEDSSAEQASGTVEGAAQELDTTPGTEESS